MSQSHNLNKLENYISVCRANADHIDIAVKALKDKLTEEIFPDWTWEVQLKGTFQRKPYLLLNGYNVGPRGLMAQITMECRCCNNKNISTFKITDIQPVLTRYQMPWNEIPVYEDAIDGIVGLKLKDITKTVPDICKVLTETKKKEDLGPCKLKIQSILKQIKLNKDF